MDAPQVVTERPSLGGWDLLSFLLGVLGILLSTQPQTAWVRRAGLVITALGFAVLIARLAWHVFRRTRWEGILSDENRTLRQAATASEGEIASLEGEARIKDADISRLKDDVSKSRAELAEALQQLRWKDMDRASHTVAVAKSLWEAPNDHEHTEYGFEDDPVNLQFALDPKLADLVAQPIVQRLSHIKQLSFAYLKFRSATHPRLAHSLGASKNAEAVMRRIFQENRMYSSQGGEEKIDRSLTEEQKRELVNLARVTALLHDLGHGPMSHALDIHLGVRRKTPTTKPDREFSISYIDRYLRQAIKNTGADPDKVIQLLRKDRVDLGPWMHFIGDLVDSPLDVDRMDYLARDARMAGLAAGALNMQALIERIVPFREVGEGGAERVELAFDSSAVPYVEQFIYARDVMYIHCYEDAGKIAAEKMFGSAFEEFVKETKDRPGLTFEDLALMTDQQITELILSCCGRETTPFRMIEMLMRGTVFECIDEVPVPVDLSPPNWEAIFHILPRDLYDPVTQAIRQLRVSDAGPASARRVDFPQSWEEWDRVVKALPGDNGARVRTSVKAQNKLYMENMLRKLPAEIKSWAKAAGLDLIEKAYLGTPVDWAKSLGKLSGVDASKIIVAVPSWSIVDSWNREADIRILLRDGDRYTVDHVKNKKISPIIQDLVCALAGVRLKVRVFADPTLGKADRERIRSSVEDFLR
jgi:HD superfamily phosphohydrolase